MNQRSITSLLCASVLLVILGAGCASSTSPFNPQSLQLPLSEPAWYALHQPGIDQLELPPSSSLAILDMQLVRIDPAFYRFHIEEHKPGRSIAGWKDVINPNAVLFFNGTYFREDGTSAGYLHAEKAEGSQRLFDWDKSAFVSLSPTVEIFDTAQSNVSTSSYREAFQTYPFLINNSKAAIAKDSGLKARRTFMGLDTQDRVYVGILPSPTLSLYELQEELLKLPIRWKHVVNMDGGPSTGMMSFGSHAGGEILINSQTPVPNVIVIEQKQP